MKFVGVSTPAWTMPKSLRQRIERITKKGVDIKDQKNIKRQDYMQNGSFQYQKSGGTSDGNNDGANILKSRETSKVSLRNNQGLGASSVKNSKIAPSKITPSQNTPVKYNSKMAMADDGINFTDDEYVDQNIKGYSKSQNGTPIIGNRFNYPIGGTMTRDRRRILENETTVVMEDENGKEIIVDLVPGVGSYDINRYDIFEKMRNLANRQKKKKDYNTNFKRTFDTPGVGSYNARPSTFDRPKAVSMAYRYEPKITNEEKSLGPGTYSFEWIKAIKPESRATKFPKAQRFLSMIDKSLENIKERAATLGDIKKNPTSINLNDSLEELRKKSSKQGTFQQSKREDYLKNTSSSTRAGPGAYYINVNDISIMSHKRKGIKLFAQERYKTPDPKLEVPGPGKYSQAEYLKKIRGGSFSKGIASFKNNLSYDDSQIGPGHYNPVSEKRVHCPPFKKYAPKDATELLPGPTDYAPRKSVVKKREPAYSIGNGVRDNERNLLKDAGVVGPGYYNPDFYSILVKKTGVKMATSQRDTFNALKRAKYIPGVGRYNIKREGVSTNKGVQFSTGARIWGPKVDPHEGVGPTGYNIRSTVPQLPPHEQARLDTEIFYKEL